MVWGSTHLACKKHSYLQAARKWNMKDGVVPDKHHQGFRSDVAVESVHRWKLSMWKELVAREVLRFYGETIGKVFIVFIACSCI